MAKVKRMYRRSTLRFSCTSATPLDFHYFSLFFLHTIRTIQGITEYSDPVKARLDSGSRIDCDTNDIYLSLYSLLCNDRILY